MLREKSDFPFKRYVKGLYFTFRLHRKGFKSTFEFKTSTADVPGLVLHRDGQGVIHLGAGFGNHLVLDADLTRQDETLRLLPGITESELSHQNV